MKKAITNIIKKSRTFACVLYPEDEEQMKILEYIKNNFEYAYILHNEKKNIIMCLYILKMLEV